MSETIIHIYKIWSPVGNLVYYGSTKSNFNTRYQRHKSSYKNYIKKGRKGFTASYVIFDAYGVENCEVELLEVINCSDFKGRRIKEASLIRSDHNSVNKVYKNNYF